MNKNNVAIIIVVVALLSSIFTFLPAEAKADYRDFYSTYNYGQYGYPAYSYGYSGTNYYGTSYNSYNSGYYGGYPTQSNYPLVVSCSANQTFVSTGANITWVANVFGGNGVYSFSWSGTDGLYGSQSTAIANYHAPGVKTASVYVTSLGQQRSVQCSNTVTVGIPIQAIYTPPPIYQQTIINNPIPNQPVTSNNIQIACFADTTTAKVGVPVTWDVEATGSGENFTYAWTGSDGLSGNQASLITTYVTTGRKSAVVTVTSANGKSQSKACGNTVNVTGTYKANTVAKTPAKPAAPAVPVVTPPAPDNSLSAATLFSLEYVPWGLVAVLVILILFITVLYLLFNKKKI